MQGIQQTKADPSPYLYVSLANLAIRTGLVGEARYWLREGTNTKRGAGSNAMWTTWGNMEWKQAADPQAAAYCFDMALRSNPRSRYALLSYAMMEKAQGNIDSARQLLRRGARCNPTDAPLRQVRCGTAAAPVLCMAWPYISAVVLMCVYACTPCMWDTSRPYRARRCWSSCAHAHGCWADCQFVSGPCGSRGAHVPVYRIMEHPSRVCGCAHAKTPAKTRLLPRHTAGSAPCNLHSRLEL